jgi:hypothetical protein
MNTQPETSKSAAMIFKTYSAEDKQAARSILDDLHQRQIDCTLLDVVKAVEPGLETPENLKDA